MNHPIWFIVDITIEFIRPYIISNRNQNYQTHNFFERSPNQKKKRRYYNIILLKPPFILSQCHHRQFFIYQKYDDNTKRHTKHSNNFFRSIITNCICFNSTQSSLTKRIRCECECKRDACVLTLIQSSSTLYILELIFISIDIKLVSFALPIQISRAI